MFPGGITHLQVSASTKKEKGSAQKGRKEHSEEPRPSGSQDFPVSLLEWDKQPLQKGKADRIAAIVLFLWELLLQPASKCTSRRNSHTCQQGCDWNAQEPTAAGKPLLGNKETTEGNNFTSSAQWTHTVARLQHSLDRISLKKTPPRTQERLIYTPYSAEGSHNFVFL